MTSPRLYPSLQAFSDPECRPLHLAVGMFDGVHLGHRAVIGEAVAAATAAGGRAGVLTFWPHPSALMNPAKRTRLMYPPAIKRALVGALGATFVIEQEFSPALSGLSPAAFVDLLCGSLPGLRGLHVGANWRFGAGRSGDPAALRQLAAARGVAVATAVPISIGGEIVSSSRIRERIASGDMSGAGALLGAPYRSSGRTVEGRRLGRGLGFPTLNLPWEPELGPALGVYVVRVRAEGGDAWLPAVANYGLRPTVEGAASTPRLEVHVLGPCPFTYGDALEVEWLHFLRAERRFGGLEALRAQIAEDSNQASEYFRLHT